MTDTRDAVGMLAAREKSLTPEIAAVFAIIAQAVEDGARCPANVEIADALGMKPKRVGRLVNGLVEQGLLLVTGSTNSRRATVVRTGKSTGAPSFPPPTPLADRVRVESHICPRCGARADYPCGHTKQPLVVRP